MRAITFLKQRFSTVIAGLKWWINTNLNPISHCFQVVADYWPNFCFRHGGNS